MIKKILIRLCAIYIFGCIPNYTYAQKTVHVKCLYSNTDAVDVTRIDYGNKMTRVHFTTSNDSVTQFSVGHGIFIVGDDGMRRHVISTKGIQLDSIYMVESGRRMNFTIDFEPVPEANTSLDVCSPRLFAIYGLHDGRVSLNIPKARYDTDGHDDNTSLYTVSETEIEGVLHDPDGSYGRRIYANYRTPRPGMDSKESRMSDIDPDGRFVMKFMMYGPQEIDFRDGTQGGGYFPKIIASPGDRLSLELYEPEEGRAVVCRNISGRPSYNRYVNAPGFLFNNTKYYRNLAGGYSEMPYAAHRSELVDAYKREMSYADYICWHYGLSPAETRLYIDRLTVEMVFWLIESDITVLTKRTESDNDEVRETCDSLISGMDCSYLRYLNPNSGNYILFSHGDIGAYIIQLKPFAECYDMIAAGSPDRLIKIIERQQEVLKKLTGWDEHTIVADQVTVNSVLWAVLGKNIVLDDEQAVTIRQLVRHPYYRQLFDTIHDELAGRGK